MLEITKAILHSIVEGKTPRKGSKTYSKIDDALFEIFTANKKLKEAEEKIKAFENADVTDNVIFVWDRTSSFIEEIRLSDERIALDIKKHYKVYIVEEV